MLLSCLAASVSLTYFPLIIFSLCVLSSSLWKPHSPTLPFSCGAQPSIKRAEDGPISILPVCLKMLEENVLPGWLARVLLLSQQLQTNVFSSFAHQPHFPPQFTPGYVDASDWKEGVWKGNRVWFKQDVCQKIKAGCSVAAQDSVPLC